MSKKILVVEDDTTMKEMLLYNLERAGFQALGATDGPAGITLAADEKPDLILLDLMLPERGGISVAQEIRKSDPDVPIIMVTALAEEETRLEGFTAGADDYVTKPFSMEELLARIRANLRRAAPVRAEGGAAILVFGDLEIDEKEFSARVAGHDISLRTKEFQLLTLLASSPGKLFSRMEISERIWGYDFIGDSRTIDVHIKNVRQKIEERSDYTFIETIRGMGYRFKMKPRTG